MCCSICLEPTRQYSLLVDQLACGHQYHQSCLSNVCIHYTHSSLSLVVVEKGGNFLSLMSRTDSSITASGINLSHCFRNCRTGNPAQQLERNCCKLHHRNSPCPFTSITYILTPRIVCGTVCERSHHCLKYPLFSLIRIFAIVTIDRAIFGGRRRLLRRGLILDLLRSRAFLWGGFLLLIWSRRWRRFLRR